MGERAVIRKALRAGANVIRAEARRRVPVRSGILRKNIITVVQVTGRKVEALVKVRKQGFYGLFVEMGNSRMSARPFLRPAADAKGEAVSQVIGEMVGEEIDKIVRAA